MSDLSAVLGNNPLWQTICTAIADKQAPHSLAAVLPLDCHSLFCLEYAHRILCFSGTGLDECPSCRSWNAEQHPDLVCLGNQTENPGIAECRSLLETLSLQPFIAPYRLAVIYGADKLSIPAANSLLKLTEEPPERGRLLYLAERDNFLDTMRSRVWMFTARPEGVDWLSVAPPASALEWGQWFEKTKKYTNPEFKAVVEGWGKTLSEGEGYLKFSDLLWVAELAEKRHLPGSLVQDLLFLVLEEGNLSEQIFSCIREA